MEEAELDRQSLAWAKMRARLLEGRRSRKHGGHIQGRRRSIWGRATARSRAWKANGVVAAARSSILGLKRIV
jgi:hypothetical protein